MKKIIGLFAVCLLAALLVTSCKKDQRTLDLSVAPVAKLQAPTDQADLALDPVTGPSIVFQWSPAYAGDSDLVLYEIAFDKADGDFSHPLYKAVSDGNGVQTQATLTQKALNKIAALAGIASSSSGKVKWAVLASKATREVLSKETRTLQIDRPAGFATVPDSLYLTGSATEGGTDISKALPLKKTADGVFEIYTSLKPGTYLLTDHRSAQGTTYYIDVANHNMIKQGSTGTTYSDTAAVYRLDYDFNVATSQATVIQGMGLYMSAYNQEIGQLSYVGNGTWEAPSIAVQFYPFSWGRDERYKFILHTPQGLEFWGSENANNVSPAGQGADYFYLLPVSNAQWDNTYKFDPSADMHNVKVDAFFTTAGPYYHQVTVL